MRNYLRGITAGLFLSTAMVASASAADVTLKFAGTLPTEHFGHAILEDMAKEIEDADVGITVKYFPAGQLGSGEELLLVTFVPQISMFFPELFFGK